VAAERRRWRPPDFARYCLQTCSRRAGLLQCRSFVEICIVNCLSLANQRAYVGGGLQPGAALVVVSPCHRDSPDLIYHTICGWLFVWLATVSSADCLYTVLLRGVAACPRWPGARSGLPCPVPACGRRCLPGWGRIGFPLRGGVWAEVGPDRWSSGGRKKGWCEEWPGDARTILFLHVISARPSKQPLMVRTFLKVFMVLGSCFVSARTNKRSSSL
jgi:hypothetical protein